MAAVNWPDLVNCALLGTSRRRPPAVGLPELAGLLDGDGERDLLRHAAAAALYRQAGAVPAAVPAGEDRAPDEDAPVCPRAQTEVLVQMLEGPSYRAVLPEWLDALAASGMRARREMLVGLLTAGTRDRTLIPRIRLVLSRRGRWLAAQRPEWAWAAGGTSDDQWETGTHAARVALLREVRASDPTRARELVESTWDADTVKDREAFLASLEDGLSAADEPLLEQALSARQQGVRAQAGALLARLPHSAYAQRMAQRLRGLVTMQRKRLGVEFPDAGMTAQLLSDGLSDKPAHGTGKGQWLLQQMVAAAPLAVWEEMTGRPPRKLIALQVENGVRDVLLAGWREAAQRQSDAAWAQALLDEHGHRNPWEMRELLGLLVPADAEAFVAGLWRTDERAAEQYLAALPRPWSEPFTRKAFERGCQLTHSAGWMRELGAHGAPAAARLQATAGTLDPGSATASHAQEALAVLTFRQTMLTDLTETT